MLYSTGCRIHTYNVRTGDVFKTRYSGFITSIDDIVVTYGNAHEAIYCCFDKNVLYFRNFYD